MAQDHKKRGLFASIFASKKKTEEELQAAEELHRKIEQRIREALVINEASKAELAIEPEPVFTRKPPVQELLPRESRVDSAQSRVDSVLAITAGWRGPVEPVSALER